MENWLVEKVLLSQSPSLSLHTQRAIDSWVIAKHYVRILQAHLKSRRSKVKPADTITECAAELMARHYDKPLALFEGFLGRTMKYSMALWNRPGMGLDEAQVAMMDDVCLKADLDDGMKILDIGCGFGALSAHLLTKFRHSRIFGLNLSRVQCDYIKRRQKDVLDPLSEDRFHLIQADFSRFHSEEKFDRIVSLGFFEHVARLDLALKSVERLLASRGKCFLHFIVSQWQATDPLAFEKKGFIERHIFPGGRIHPFLRIPRRQDGLELLGTWFLSGKNYQQTLEAWLSGFLENRETIRLQTGLCHEEMHIWEIYLLSCIAMFKINDGEFYGNGQYLFGLTHPS